VTISCQTRRAVWLGPVARMVCLTTLRIHGSWIVWRTSSVGVLASVPISVPELMSE
jgi:hypothetical protein